MKIKYQGFTLIELLVVIVIIGILSIIATATYNAYFKDARRAQVEAEVSQLIKAIIIARNFEGTSLRYITGSGCTDCGCRSSQPYYTLPESHACHTRWQNALNAIAQAARTDLGGLYTDPWGSPYSLDENEDETPCRQDTIRSVGPDGLRGNSDDIIWDVPLFNGKGCH